MNSTAARYVYDGDGQLVSKAAGGVTTSYLIDHQAPAGYTQIAEERVSGSVVRSYVYGPQRIGMNDAAGVHYYGYDAHSGVRVLLDGQGTVTDTWDYDAFGNVITRTGTTANDFTYRGEQMDGALSLQYLRARWMNPASGRFGTMDSWEPKPSLPLTANTFLAFNGSPVENADPTGHGPIAVALLGTRVHQELGTRFVNGNFAEGETARFADLTINALVTADGQPRGNIMSAGWLLRPDLVSYRENPVTHQMFGDVYEIKPASWYGLTLGPIQLATYLDLLNERDPKRVFVAGQRWTPPSTITVSGIVPGTTAQVQVSGPTEGMIYYYVDDAIGESAVIGLTAIAVGALLVPTLAPGAALAGI